MSVEKLAQKFLASYVHETKTEIVPVMCVGEDRRRQPVPSHADVHNFLKTLDQDGSIRFDVSDTEVPESLVHAEPEPETETYFDRTILARRVRKHSVYYAGTHRSGRLLWTTDARLAKVFVSEDEIIVEVFESDGLATMRQVFNDIDLRLVSAPQLPEGTNYDDFQTND